MVYSDGRPLRSSTTHDCHWYADAISRPMRRGCRADAEDIHVVNHVLSIAMPFRHPRCSCAAAHGITDARGDRSFRSGRRDDRWMKSAAAAAERSAARWTAVASGAAPHDGGAAAARSAAALRLARPAAGWRRRDRRRRGRGQQLKGGMGGGEQQWANEGRRASMGGRSEATRGAIGSRNRAATSPGCRRMADRPSGLSTPCVRWRAPACSGRSSALALGLSAAAATGRSDRRLPAGTCRLGRRQRSAGTGILADCRGLHEPPSAGRPRLPAA